MKTFKISIVWPGTKPKCFIMLAGPNIYIYKYITIFSELFFVNLEQIPDHNLVKSDVDICPFQL